MFIYIPRQDGPANAVWIYGLPKQEMLAIKGLLAFCPDKVDAISASSAFAQH